MFSWARTVLCIIPSLVAGGALAGAEDALKVDADKVAIATKLEVAGAVDAKSTLSVAGTATAGALKVAGTVTANSLNVTGPVTAGTSLTVTENLSAKSAQVSGTTTTADLAVTGSLSVASPATVQLFGPRKMYLTAELIGNDKAPTIPLVTDQVAATDGFVIGIMVPSLDTNTNCRIDGVVVVDGKDVVLGSAGVYAWSSISHEGDNYYMPRSSTSFTMPVRKGETWKVVFTRQDAFHKIATCTVYWMPLGGPAAP